MPRIPNLPKELPDASKRKLLEYGISISAIQAWLDHPETKFDGATGVLDLCLPAEAVHDYLYRHSLNGITRGDADYLFRFIMLDYFTTNEADLTSRYSGYVAAWRRWAGVRVFGGCFARAWLPHSVTKRVRLWVE